MWCAVSLGKPCFQLSTNSLLSLNRQLVGLAFRVADSGGEVQPLILKSL